MPVNPGPRRMVGLAVSVCCFLPDKWRRYTLGPDEEGVGNRWHGNLSRHRARVLILGNVRLLEYGGLVWLLFHLFVLFYEEPTLRASFGSEYESYCAVVPRWIPRVKTWRA